jgi:hypothetical protein
LKKNKLYDDEAFEKTVTSKKDYMFIASKSRCKDETTNNILEAMYTYNNNLKKYTCFFFFNLDIE